LQEGKVKTVKKVLDILEAFEKPQIELGVTELVELSGMNTSTVYRICSELVQRGYLARVENRGKYRLGQHFVKFFDSLSELNNLKDIALVYMQKLSKDINESVTMSVLVGSEISDIVCVTTSHKLQLLPKLGETLPLHCTSAGKIFLSQMDSDSLDRIIRIKGLPARTTNTITDLNMLNKEISVIRREGISFDDEEFELGIRSVAAQVKKKEGTVISALAVIGPSVRISLQKMRDLIPAIKGCASEISKAIGYKND
jgi:IclR family transcriptional regulator, KDG regulon repressor